MLCGTKTDVPVSPVETAFAVDEAVLMSTGRIWVVVSEVIIIKKTIVIGNENYNKSEK